MTINLSQKLFTQKDGKRFAYADAIKEFKRQLFGKQHPVRGQEGFVVDWEDIEELLGKELIE